MSIIQTATKRATITLLTLTTVSILLIIAACSSTTTSPNPTQQALVEEVNRLSTEVASLSEEVNNPSFSITLWQGQDVLGGNKVALESLLGEGPLILNFWAAESQISRAELLKFQSFYENHASQVLVLAVDVGPVTGQTTPKQGMKFLEELNVTFPVGYTTYLYALSEHGVKGLPTTIFFNADGTVNSKFNGALNEEILINRTKEVLASRQPRATNIQNTDCDQLLRNQLKFQKAASTDSRMNEVIRQIQNQRDSCVVELWNPQVTDATSTAVAPYAHATNPACFSSAADGKGPYARVGNTQVPAGLRADNDLDEQVRIASGRDSNNNIIVYWSTDADNRPQDGSICWIYVDRLNSWDEGY